MMPRARPPMRAAVPFGVAALVVLFFDPRRASAFEALVDTQFEAQMYEVDSPFGDPYFRRNRYTHTLALRIYDLEGAPPRHGPRFDAAARLRLDADLGIADAEVNPDRTDRFVPGLEQAPLDLMMAYVEGRGLLDGYLGFRIGRQYTIGPLGFWSFDGAMARIDTPAFFAVEGFGGFEQRGGLPLSTSRFEADGVFRGDRTGMDREEWPAFLEESKLAPAYGFAVVTSGVRFLDARLEYRKVINRDSVLVSPFPDPMAPVARVSDDRVSTERVGLSANAVADGLGAIEAQGVYDFYVSRPTEHALGADWFVSDKVRLGAGYDYFLPTFDGDSIFNWFAHGATTTVEGRGSWDATRRLALATSWGFRSFRTETDVTDVGRVGNVETTQIDALGSLSSRYRFSAGDVSARASAEAGQRGHQAGGDLSGMHRFENGLYDARVVLSLYDWADPLRPSRDATSFSYVIGGGITPFETTHASVEWQHSMNRLVGQQFRFLLALDVTIE